MNSMYILEISEKIANMLKIDSNTLKSIIESRLTEEQLNEEITDTGKINKINELFAADSNLLEFEKKHIKKNTQESFKKLKDNLGKLQILVLIKNLEKTKDCDSVLNVLLGVLNNKFNTVNNILSGDLVQNGGGVKSYGSSVIYFNKYVKYKIKYLKLVT